MRVIIDSPDSVIYVFFLSFFENDLITFFKPLFNSTTKNIGCLYGQVKRQVFFLLYFVSLLQLQQHLHL